MNWSTCQCYNIMQYILSCNTIAIDFILQLPSDHHVSTDSLFNPDT